jgi:predicted ABC-type ATPase
MAAKRMRVFAGPNGSGKTTIFKGILNESKVNLGIYVNADEIEETISQSLHQAETLRQSILKKAFEGKLI